MKAAIYIRVSKRDQHPENQLQELKDMAIREGWQYEVFEEKESTRKTRPIKQAVMNKARQKEIDAILVWKLDRWARSLQELIADMNELTQHTIRFISKRDGIDLQADQNAVSRLQFQLLGAFSEFEREIIRERTLSGLDRAKAEGKHLGRPAGSKDKKRRKTSGYLLYWKGKKK